MNRRLRISLIITLAMFALGLAGLRGKFATALLGEVEAAPHKVTQGTLQALSICDMKILEFFKSLQ